MFVPYSASKICRMIVNVDIISLLISGKRQDSVHTHMENLENLELSGNFEKPLKALKSP